MRLAAACAAIVLAAGCSYPPPRYAPIASLRGDEATAPAPLPETIEGSAWPGAVWAAGLWDARGPTMVWVPGRWERAPAGWSWVPYRWVRAGAGYRFVGGRWVATR